VLPRALGSAGLVLAAAEISKVVHPDVPVPVLPAAFLAARPAVLVVHLVPDEMADAARSAVVHRVAGLRASVLPDLLLPDAAQSAGPVVLADAQAALLPVALPVPRVQGLLPQASLPARLELRRVLLVSPKLRLVSRPVALPPDAFPEPLDAAAQSSASLQVSLSDALVPLELPRVLQAAQPRAPLVSLLQAPPERPHHARERQPAPPVSLQQVLQPEL
jgi:hypothetical protein